MPYLPWIPAAEADLSPEERSFEALLSAAPLPDEAPADSQLLADLVSALTAPAADAELAGFCQARAAYTTQLTPGFSGRSLRWRPPMLDHLPSPKIAAALAAGVLSLGGLSAAAYAGALPETAQNIAHQIIGAPATHPGKGGSHAPEQAGAPTSTPAGPDATGAAAFGLCTAYQHSQGGDGSAAFENLAAAAGGADKIDAYCATIAQPGSAAHATGKPSATPSHAVGVPSSLPAHPTGKPSTLPAHPTGKPSSLPAHPTGQPSTVPAHPTGKPSTLPAHPTGKPSSLPAHPTGQPSTVPAHPTGKPSTVPAGPTSRPAGP